MLQLELACSLDLKPILCACYSLEGDGLAILLAYSKLESLLTWGADIGKRADSLPNVAALLRARADVTVGLKVLEYFADVNPPQWFKGEIVQPRREGLITVKYQDQSKIDQEEREVRQWIDVRQFPAWDRMSQAAKAGIQYLRNRLEGNLPPQQVYYDCSTMFGVLRALRVFDPSWAASNLTADAVDALLVVKPLVPLVPALHNERAAYGTKAASVTIDHTETAEDHSFTDQVLKFFRTNKGEFATWSKAARIVFAFTPNSAAAERVFSMLKSMFGASQMEASADYVQASVMLRYNKRAVG